MKIAVLGTGMVGTTIATKLIELGHEVTLGSRKADNDKAKAWLEQVDSDRASAATFADAAASAELVFNCTAGAKSLEALRMAGAENLADKILVDLANPLDFSNGTPPTLSVCNETSLGEQIQAAFPEARVVKTLNTISAEVMVEPRELPGEHVVFVSGDDADAKRWVEQTLLRDWLDWPEVVDLGDISTARGTEMYLALWVRMWGALGTPAFNISIVRRG
ncbi:2-dehydropantoate 2-reductase [Enhygromyxa salina]|uniref:2-dehydropantoate 2-reductase n=1 Tax=Enhygromyxa salina TaxID=215803 RepID=A0A2S9XEV1_9BACT|nr:NAD(P)-binding domain-containing protein [Enhygromyxa salina]PRP91280.1 2-dehydropantoate 2-reductase [Enhygromyxa salina]